MKRKKGYFALIGLAALLFMASWLLPWAAAPVQAQYMRYVKQEVPKNNWADAAPAQPIPYSHKNHAEVVECETCHVNPERGGLMSFPASSTCMGATRPLPTTRPPSQKLAQYDESQESVPWVRVYTLRPGIAWSHSRHLDAGVTCATCHGEVAQMDVVAEVTSVTTKSGCLNCHTMRSAATNCETCHPWPSEAWRGRTAQFGGNPTWP